jgi:hypothetical protein
MKEVAVSKSHGNTTSDLRIESPEPESEVKEAGFVEPWITLRWSRGQAEGEPCGACRRDAIIDARHAPARDPGSRIVISLC